MGQLSKVETGLEHCCLREFVEHRQARFLRLGKEQT